MCFFLKKSGSLSAAHRRWNISMTSRFYTSFEFFESFDNKESTSNSLKKRTSWPHDVFFCMCLFKSSTKVFNLNSAKGVYKFIEVWRLEAAKGHRCYHPTISESYSAYLSHVLGTKNLGEALADFWGTGQCLVEPKSIEHWHWVIPRESWDVFVGEWINTWKILD